MPCINTLSLMAASAGLASMAVALPVTTTSATTITLVERAEIVPSSTTETHIADIVADMFFEAAKSHSLIPIAEPTATIEPLDENWDEAEELENGDDDINWQDNSEERGKKIMDEMIKEALANQTHSHGITVNESDWRMARRQVLSKRINITDDEGELDDESEDDDEGEDDEEDVFGDEAFRHMLDRLAAAGSNRTLAEEIFADETKHWREAKLANLTTFQPLKIARRQLVANPANLTNEEAKPLMQKIEVMLDEYDKLLATKKEMEAAYAKLEETAPVNQTKILPTTDRPAILSTKEGRELEIKLAHGRYEIWQEFAKLERGAGVNGTHIKEQLKLVEEENAFFLGKNEQQVEDALEELEEQEREELIENLPEGPWER